MTYRLLAFSDIGQEPPEAQDVPALYLDGMLVADRALEDVVFKITLTEDRRDIRAAIATPDTFPPLMDKARTLEAACVAAKGADILETRTGGDGMLWNEAKMPMEQILEFETAPKILNGAPLASP